MDYEELFDATSFCPYSKQCESYKTIINSEEWISKALSKLRRMGGSALPRDEGVTLRRSWRVSWSSCGE